MPTHSADRFKQKHQFIPLRRNFVDIIDAFKVADFAILLMSADVEVDKFGLLCLSAVQSQGLISVVPVVQVSSEVECLRISWCWWLLRSYLVFGTLF